MMQVRAATVEDAEALERIRVRSWQVAYRHVFPPAKLDALPIDASKWRESLSGPPPGHSCFVAEDKGRIIGWATISPSGDGRGELRGIYVDPDTWRSGAGRALIARAEERLAREWDEAMLWVIADNPRARAFYESAGWEFDGVTSTFEYFDVQVPIVCYVKRLSSATSRS
jgi:GNAT superfamily N-acetyltransferase